LFRKGAKVNIQPLIVRVVGRALSAKLIYTYEKKP